MTYCSSSMHGEGTVCYRRHYWEDKPCFLETLVTVHGFVIKGMNTQKYVHYHLITGHKTFTFIINISVKR